MASIYFCRKNIWYVQPFVARRRKSIAYRLQTLLTGPKDASFLATQTLKKHLKEIAETVPMLKETYEKLIESLYMDDSTLNKDEEQSAAELYHTARKIFKIGGFELVK